MSQRARAGSGCTVAAFCRTMEAIAPTGLAQDWDNVGLLAGDLRGTIRRVLACIDLTTAVVQEAVKAGADLVLAYHPPIFKPISAIRADSTETDAVVHECIRNDLAIYATHTALDAADGGTNDVIAALCGAEPTSPLEYVDEPDTNACKLVIFVPQDHLEKVAEATFVAGAGRIGDYTRCSYRTTGRGTFLGGQATHPTIGQRGRMEFVEETRLETVVPSRNLPAVVQAMIDAHPYEEPAFDIYPLQSKPAGGIGRRGTLPRPTTLLKLARKLKRATRAACVQTIGSSDRKVDRVVIVVGAAGSLPFRGALRATDVVITGEIRHHDALAIERHGCSAIALGHWASERPVLAPLCKRLMERLPGVAVRASEADRDPCRSV